jgi:hypothetical protein
VSDDDLTPATPPPAAANRAALSTLADLCFLVDAYLRGLRTLAGQLRRFPGPAPAEWRDQLAALARDCGEPAARLAAEAIEQARRAGGGA